MKPSTRSIGYGVRIVLIEKDVKATVETRLRKKILTTSSALLLTKWAIDFIKQDVVLKVAVRLLIFKHSCYFS
jgi:hypothetical protein